MAYELGQAFVQIMPTAKGISGKISSLLDGDAEKAGQAAGGKFSASFGGAIGKLGTAAVSALAAGSAALAAFGASSVKTGMEFDSAMSQVAATMGLTMDEMASQTGTVELAWGTFTGNLRDYAQEMGANTAFSATQASEALNYMALAGYDVQTSMEMLPNVLNLAAAGSMDLAEASDMVTDTQSALGLSLEETTTMVDQMAATSSKSNTSVSQLGDAMLKIGATARNVKGGTQELSTVLGVLADNGIKGAEGGTHLRNILLSLQGAAENGAVDFGEFAVSVYDAEGNMRSTIDIIEDMQTGMGDMSQEARDAMLSGIFNKTDLSSINALLGTSKDRFTELTGAIGDAAGAAQEMADTQLDNLAGDVTLFQSALEGVKIAISDYVTPTLRDFVQMGSDGLTEITGKLKSGDLAGAAESFGNTLGDGISKAVEKLPSIVEAGGKLVSGLMAGITENIDSIADGIADVAVSIVDFFSQNIGTFITGAVKLAGGIASGLISNLPQILVGVGEGIINGLYAALTSLPEMISGLLDSAFNLFGADFDGISNTFVEETDAIIRQSDNLEYSWDKVRQTKESAISNADEEYSYYQTLADELGTLYDKNGKVLEGEQSRVDFITTTLSNALGIEYDDIYDLVQGNSDYAESIDKVIEKKHAEAILAAEEEAASEALSQRKDIVMQMTDVQGQLAEAYEQAAKAVDSAEGIWEQSKWLSTGMGYDEAMKQVEAWAANKAGINELETEYAELETALTETYQNEAQYAADYERFMEGNYDSLGQLAVDYSQLNSENVDQILADAERERDGLEESYHKAAEMYASGEINDSQLESARRQLDTAQATVDGLVAKQEALQQATIKNGEGVVSTITDITGKAYTQVDYAGQKFGAAGGRWMPNIANSVTNNGGLVRSSVSGVIDSALAAADRSGEFGNIGYNLTSGLAAGISSNVSAAVGAIESVMNSVVAKARSVPQVQSPSKVTKQIGAYIVEGLGLGITENAGLAVSAAEDTMTGVMDAMDTDAAFDITADSSLNSMAAGAVENIQNTLAFAGATPDRGTEIYITNYIDGAEDPENYAARLCRQIKLEMRMA